MKTENKIKILQKCLVFNKNKILLLQRAKDDSLGGFWDLPGGNLEFLEEMEQAMKREVKEESGLVIRRLKKVGMKEIVVKDNEKHFLVFIYSAEAKSNKVKLSLEHQNFKWVDRNELSKFNLSPLFRNINLKVIKW